MPVPGPLSGRSMHMVHVPSFLEDDTHGMSVRRLLREPRQLMNAQGHTWR